MRNNNMMNLRTACTTETKVRSSLMDNIFDPPFEETCKQLMQKSRTSPNTDTVAIKEHNLPTIDLHRLIGASEEERERCKREITKFSMEWGFFQLVNHGITQEELDEIGRLQVRAFRKPFEEKKSNKCLGVNLSTGSYRWGTPTATSLAQFSWSEAFHIPLIDLSIHGKDHDDVSSTMKQFATRLSDLAIKLANILAEKLGHDQPSYFEENCLPSTCYLRMNRYPPCPNYSHMFGLMPHTDSDFLTILHQDQVGGLQLVKDGTWIAVKPNPDALIVNIGDLFQVWSNGLYKSVEHRVVANPSKERYSTAYFLCPSYDVVVQSCKEPSIYKKFSFREYRQQVQDDVVNLGYKIGLSRFLVCN